MMSPGLVACPLGMFSVAGTTASRLAGIPSSAIAATASITAAPPDMSIFISCMAAEGLIEIPPESKVTALPTSASSGPSPSIRIEISFGGWSVPAETACEAAHAALHHLVAVHHLDADRIVGGGDLQRPLGEVGGGGDVGGQVLQLTGAVGRLGGDAGDLGALGQLRVAQQRQRLDLGWRGLVALLLGVGVGLEAVEAVGGQHGALDQRGRELLV